MSAAGKPALFVCYVPGLDLRRISDRETPYIAALLRDCPRVRIRTIPDTELVPTILTGVYPHDHGVWQVRLRGWSTDRRPVDRLLNLIPDGLTTTVQGLAHALTGSVDLATIPWRRRRRFELHRFKYERREHGWIEPSPLAPSVFSRLDGGTGRYAFCRRFSRLEATLENLVEDALRLEFFELYAFDLTQHWNLDRPQVMREACRRVDAAVRRLHAKSLDKGRTFLLLSDHGQEPVRGTIDLRAALEADGVPEGDYALFLQVPSARFWFRTEEAREATLEVLRRLPSVTVLEFGQLRRYGLEFTSGTFGEVFAFADAGHVFFPHDFYQPLANLFLGLSDPQQRPRVRNPVHRGCHGYLPENESERGFALVGDADHEADREEAELIDLAPTLLELLALPKPRDLPGSCVFARR